MIKDQKQPTFWGCEPPSQNIQKWWFPSNQTPCFWSFWSTKRALIWPKHSLYGGLAFREYKTYIPRFAMLITMIGTGPCISAWQ